MIGLLAILAAAGGAAYYYGTVKPGTRSPSYAPKYEGGPGWYVLLHDRIGEPGRPRGRLKEFDGPYETKRQAEDDAIDRRSGGWSGPDASATVQYRKKAPF